MSHFLKILITSVLLALTLSACKPGIYYDSVANKKKAEMARKAQATASAAPVAKAPVAGEKMNTIIPG